MTWYLNIGLAVSCFIIGWIISKIYYENEERKRKRYLK